MNYRFISPGALLAPVPAVLVTVTDQAGKPNTLAVAWTGIVCSKPPMLSISVRKERYSHGLITDRGEFTVSLVSRDLLPALDLCGVKSGRDTDKFTLCGILPTKTAGAFSAPAVEGTPLYLNCRVASVQELGSHDLFIANIVDIGVREDLIDQTGRIMMEKADLIAYCHGIYYGLSEALGFFGYTVAAPGVLERRMNELRDR